MIPDSFKQDLLNRTDIVELVSRYVQLKKGGANFQGLCPFHSEKSASFTVSPAKQFYHCFGCGAHGNAIGFLMAYGGMGYVDAVKDLAASAGLTVPETPRSPLEVQRREREGDLYAVMQTAMDFYRAQLKNAPRAIAYLKGRGLTGEVAARFRIGYAPDDWQGLKAAFPDYQDKGLVEAGLVVESDAKRYDRFRDRVMFPIFSQRGAVIGFGGRVIEKGDEGDSAMHAAPKYLNSPETALFEKGRELYGLLQARDAIHSANRVLVVEGYMDVVALAQYGVAYAVATLGTATTPAHVTKLLRLADEIIYCFDGDAAGRKAAWRALEVSLPLAVDHKPIRFLFLPPEDDPDSYVRAHGKASFERLAGQAQTLTGFLLGELRAAADLVSAEGRSKFLTEAKPHMQKFAAPALRLQLLKEIAELARVSQAEAEALLELNPGGGRRYVRPAPARAMPPLTTSQEQNLLRCVLAHPALAGELDVALLDNELAETAALRTIAGWLEDEDAPSEAMLIERLQGSQHESVVFAAQTSLLEFQLTPESAEQQFRQIVLSLKIKRKHEEYEALKRQAASGVPGRELVVELDRRAKELAQLKGQRI